jgi:hypothetical protein
MSNPIVFVSHAATDAAIATKFKDDVERRYLGLCTLFVSSSLDSLNAGDEWIQAIKRNLNDAAIMIDLLAGVMACANIGSALRPIGSFLRTLRDT